MAPTTPDREQENYRRAVKYVANVLRKNPLEEGGEIIARRNRLLGLKDASPQAAAVTSQVDRRQRREAIIKTIDQLRANFWSAPLADLHSTLEKLDASDFPDLQAAATRLKVVAAHRGQFPALTSYRQFDPDFFSVFKEVLVSSPKESAIAKERMLASFSTRQKRWRGQKMIKLLERALPDVYNLEATWLDALARQRASTSRRHSAPPPQTVGAVGGGFSFPWWLIPLGIVILRLLVSAGRH